MKSNNIIAVILSILGLIALLLDWTTLPRFIDIILCSLIIILWGNIRDMKKNLNGNKNERR